MEENNNAGVVKESSIGNLNTKLLLAHQLQIHLLDFVAGPWGAAQENQTGFNGGVVFEAIDIDFKGHVFPAIVFDQRVEDIG